MSVNKVILVGNLGRDPEVRYLPSGQTVAKFTLATSDSFSDRAGARQERTEWHNIVVWGKQAELCGQYLKKGRQAYIEGRISIRLTKPKTVAANAIAPRSLRSGAVPRRRAGAGSGMDEPLDIGGPSDGAPAPMDDEDIPF